MADASNSPHIERAPNEKSTVPNNPSVGIVIVNFYTADYLRRCLSALALQRYCAHEILVIDNGDHADTLDFIAAEHPTVRVLQQDNIGFAAANNLAIAELDDCQWIALLNPDAFPEPEWLEQLVHATSIYPEALVFSSRLLQEADAQILDGDGDSYHLSGLAWRHNHGRLPPRVEQAREVFSACAAAALYRRDALVDVGGFDPSYFCYFEDVDLGFRLRLRGYRCMQIPTARVIHVGGGASNGEKQSDFALYHGHRNLVWTFVKNMPGCWFWLLLPLHILLNVFEIIWFTCRGRGKVIWRAKRDALRRMSIVWEQRETIQSQRNAAARSILRRMSFWPLTLDR